MKTIQQVFPNPFKDETTIFLANENADQARLEIIDLSGRLLYQTSKRIEPFEKWVLDRQMLPSISSNSQLFIKISTDGGYTQTAKLLFIGR